MRLYFGRNMSIFFGMIWVYFNKYLFNFFVNFGFWMCLFVVLYVISLIAFVISTYTWSFGITWGVLIFVGNFLVSFVLNVFIGDNVLEVMIIECVFFVMVWNVIDGFMYWIIIFGYLSSSILIRESMKMLYVVVCLMVFCKILVRFLVNVMCGVMIGDIKLLFLVSNFFMMFMMFCVYLFIALNVFSMSFTKYSSWFDWIIVVGVVLV